MLSAYFPVLYFQGLSLSGGEQEEGQRKVISGMMSTFPKVSKSYKMCTDTFGAIATSCKAGKTGEGRPIGM